MNYSDLIRCLRAYESFFPGIKASATENGGILTYDKMPPVVYFGWFLVALGNWLPTTWLIRKMKFLQRGFLVRLGCRLTRVR